MNHIATQLTRLIATLKSLHHAFCFPVVCSCIDIKSLSLLIMSASYNVSTFLPRLQHQVAKDYSMQKTTVDSVNAFLDLVCDHVVNVTSQLIRQTEKQTVDVKSIHYAIRLVFPDDLGKFAISAGTTAVERYRSASKSSNAKRVSRSARAGLVFPVSRMISVLRRSADRVQPLAAVFLTAVVEFIATELLESASESTSSGKRKQITVFDLNRSVWGDRGIQTKDSSWMSGDAEMQKLAKRVKWGSLGKGWKGIYTESGGRHRKKQKKNEDDVQKKNEDDVQKSGTSVVISSNATTL